MSEYLNRIKFSVYIQVYIHVKTTINTCPVRRSNTIHFKSYKTIKNKRNG